jgi:large subunit ribosomal protein L32
MAPLPKRRHSTQRQGKRRRKIEIKLTSLYACPNCGQPKQPHQVCLGCGYYKGKLVIDLEKRKKKKDEKSKRSPTP